MKISIKEFLIGKSKLEKKDKGSIMKHSVCDFQRYDVESLEELFYLVSRNVVYAPLHWKRNYRKISNAMLKKIDLIVYDSDDGDTSDELLEMLDGMEALILQTSGWTPEKEKHRIFIPLAKPITFESPEEYTFFYRWFGDAIGLNYDKSTTECGRGYIGLSKKKGIILEHERLDISEEWKEEKIRYQKKKKREELRNYLRSTDRPKTQNSATPSSYEIRFNDKRFNQIALECGSGNNYKTVFKLLSYCKFRGMDARSSSEAVCFLKLGNEYENVKDLMNKYERA